MCVNLFPNHHFYWGDQHYALTVGPERAERMNACATALATGVPLAIHSDAPVTPLGPLFTAWCAVNRKTASGRTLGEHERICVADALRTITLGAAYTFRLDAEVGSIECGKQADSRCWRMTRRDRRREPEGRAHLGHGAGRARVRGGEHLMALPVTVLGGYLGAGKTTLVNHLLRTGGRRLGVLVNEFGTLPIDADLIEARRGICSASPVAASAAAMAMIWCRRCSISRDGGGAGPGADRVQRGGAAGSVAGTMACCRGSRSTA